MATSYLGQFSGPAIGALIFFSKGNRMKLGFKHALIILLISSVFACSGGGSGGGTTGGGGTSNTAPVANAGANQSVSTGATVTLSASASSDANNDTITYLWSITSSPTGSAATLSSATAVAPTFVADTAGAYVFGLVVNDGTVNSVASSVTVDATTPNTAPVAQAGSAQNVVTGSVVTLSGSSSTDGDGDALTYAWTLSARPANSVAALSSATAVSPTFTADINGTYTAELIVNDGTDNSAVDVVSVVASSVNSAPVANAGADQSAVTGTVVTLNGTASSDADGDTLTYAWTLTPTASSTASLDDASSASPKFTADAGGVYEASLVVNDGTVDSAAVTVEISVSSNNSAPTAIAGVDQNVLVDNVVNLDGTSSTDVNGDELTYQWSLTTSPSGSTATLADSATASASFTPVVAGEYVLQLIVNDGIVDSAADTITIVASDGNSAPIANAGADFVVKTGLVASLDGSASSDANGDGLLYTWSFVSRPTGSTAALDDATAVNATFVTDVQGSYVLSLVVSDTMVDSASDTILVRVADAEITLSEKVGVFGSTFNEVPFPYDEEITLNTDVVGSPQPTTVTVDAYQIVALGGDLTIINLIAENETNDLVPFFDGDISEGFILEDGEVADFGLVSPLTGGDRIQLRFSFEIQETGQVFTSSYLLTSN